MEGPNSTSPRVLSAGIDWLTATARPEQGADELAHLGGALVQLERDAGNRQRDWRWKEYVGLAAGGASFGSRRDGTIVRASGALADVWARSIAALAGNLSRCDLQVTWIDHWGDADAAVMKLYRERTRTPERGRPIERTILRPELTGPTIYTGKRSSDHYGRIYDKHSEEPDIYPRGAVRAEIEAKGKTAQALRGRIADGDVDTSFVLTFTGRWYQRRGIALPIPHGGRAELDLAPRPPTDAARTLHWLKCQVAPGVARSLAWSGPWATLEALGLGTVVADLISRGQPQRYESDTG